MRVTLTEKQFILLSQLYKRNSAQSLTKLVRGEELADFQTCAVAHGLIAEACVYNVDTGLGKTMISAGLINAVKAYVPNLKWIFLCQCSNIGQTYKKLSMWLNDSNIAYSDSTEDSILDVFFTRKAITADVVILSYEAIICPSVESFLFKNRHLFKGVFIDESQLISNLSSHTSQLVSAIVNNCRYKFALTATPLRINIDQVVNQVYMVDRHLFDGNNLDGFLRQFKVWDDGRVVAYQNLEQLQQLLAPRMFSFTRSELGMRGDYRPLPVLVDTRGRYATVPRLDQTKVMKSDKDGPALKALGHEITRCKALGLRGLIYANLNEVKVAARDYLKELGIRVAILDGRHTNTSRKKDAMQMAFNSGEYDVIITNLTTGKDLPCDYICFYEQTFDYKQMLGRGERGLAGVNLDIIFILCKDTYELDFFYENVYQRGLLLETLCGKDLSELKQAVKEIESILKSKKNYKIGDFTNANYN